MSEAVVTDVVFECSSCAPQGRSIAFSESATFSEAEAIVGQAHVNGCGGDGTARFVWSDRRG